MLNDCSYYKSAFKCGKIASVSVLALVQTFAYLVPGSCLYHASQTKLGGAADGRLNDLFSFVGYQAAVSNLEPLDSPIIHDLSLTPRYAD